MVNTYFLDSSALVKRYITETGSAWIQTILSPQSMNIIIVARITWVEVLSAFSRLRREGKITQDELKMTIRLFQRDWVTQYHIVEINQQVVETASQLVQKYPLRAYDGVQLAAALQLDPTMGDGDPATFIFIASDDRLIMVARAEDLNTDNPNNHS